jgi:hypothetical protein
VTRAQAKYGPEGTGRFAIVAELYIGETQQNAGGDVPGIEAYGLVQLAHRLAILAPLVVRPAAPEVENRLEGAVGVLLHEIVEEFVGMRVLLARILSVGLTPEGGGPASEENGHRQGATETSFPHRHHRVAKNGFRDRLSFLLVE